MLRVEKLPVGAGSDLVDDGGFEVEEDAARDVLSSSGLAEECIEGIITASNGFVGGHLAVGLDAVLKAEEFPTGDFSTLSNSSQEKKMQPTTLPGATTPSEKKSWTSPLTELENLQTTALDFRAS